MFLDTSNTHVIIIRYYIITTFIIHSSLLSIHYTFIYTYPKILFEKQIFP